MELGEMRRVSPLQGRFERGGCSGWGLACLWPLPGVSDYLQTVRPDLRVLINNQADATVRLIDTEACAASALCRPIKFFGGSWSWGCTG